MQVADEFEVFSMLDGEALERAVDKHHPDIIVPEIEAIRTERLYDLKGGHTSSTFGPCRQHNHEPQGHSRPRCQGTRLENCQILLRQSYDELVEHAKIIGFPCVVKPLMSSSGKGQSLVKTADDLKHAWEYAMGGSRGDIHEVIIEEFIHFDSEITLLTVTQKNGPTLFCPPIGHVQKAATTARVSNPHT